MTRYKKRRKLRKPPLQEEDLIVALAGRYCERVGKWPTRASGNIPEEPGETWQSISIALIEGRRGLSGGSSLVCLLAAHRGVRNRAQLPTAIP